MAAQASLHSIAKHWAEILSDPAVARAHDEHDTLKGDDHDHGHEHGEDHDDNPMDAVIEDLRALSQGQETEIKPQTAQTLYFLQQAIKSQIKALHKSSLPGMKDKETKALIHDLTRSLADIETLAPAKELERFAKLARNAERNNERPGGKNRPLVNGYKNWLDGTLTDDQTAVLKALQWKTATGNFQPLKIIVDTADHFAEDHLKDPKSILTTALITKLVVDSIVVMTSVTGAHKSLQEAAENADQVLAETGNLLSTQSGDGLYDGLLSDLNSLVPEINDQALQSGIDAILDERCMEKINTATNFVGMGIEKFAAGYCHEISQSLQTWFAISTATPRTLQAGQKHLAESLLTEGSFAAESYNRHHEEASRLVDFLAFYDNALHVTLLGIGSLVGIKLIKEYGVKDGPKKMLKDLNQQLLLAKKRPGAFMGVFAGGGAYAGLNGGEVLNTDILPFLVVGALGGVLAQRAKIHLAENKSFIFNLHASRQPAQITQLPRTSLDEKRYIGTKIAASVLLASATAIAANNTGLIDHQSPEAFKASVDTVMASWAWTGGVLSWAIFDRLDDFVYHKTFFGLGVPTGAAVATATIAAGYGLSKLPGAKNVKQAWDKTIQASKKAIQPAVLTAKLNFSEPDQTQRYGHARATNPNVIWPSEMSPAIR